METREEESIRSRARVIGGEIAQSQPNASTTSVSLLSPGDFIRGGGVTGRRGNYLEWNWGRTYLSKDVNDEMLSRLCSLKQKLWKRIETLKHADGLAMGRREGERRKLV